MHSHANKIITSVTVNISVTKNDPIFLVDPIL